MARAADLGAGARLDEGAAAGGEHPRPLGEEPRDHPPLAVAERRLAERGEDLRDRHAGRLGDLGVGVGEAARRAARRAACRRWSCPRPSARPAPACRSEPRRRRRRSGEGCGGLDHPNCRAAAPELSSRVRRSRRLAPVIEQFTMRRQAARAEQDRMRTVLQNRSLSRARRGGRASSGRDLLRPARAAARGRAARRGEVTGRAARLGGPARAAALRRRPARPRPPSRAAPSPGCRRASRSTTRRRRPSRAEAGARRRAATTHHRDAARRRQPRRGRPAAARGDRLRRARSGAPDRRREVRGR